MTPFLEKLNLTAQERRILVLVIVVLFVVLNAFFVVGEHPAHDRDVPPRDRPGAC